MSGSDVVDLSICFCAWNEEVNIADCIADAISAAAKLAPHVPEVEILVVDNASTDRTPEVVRAISARDTRVRLIRHDTNRLYSGSHRTAFREARGKRVAILDGDFQHQAADIGRALDLMESSGVEVVFGWKQDRHDGPMRQLFSIGLRFASGLLIGHRLHDINCGFRVFSRRAVEAIQIAEQVNSVGPEIYCECRRLDLAIGEIVVAHAPRVSGEGLHNTIWPLLKNTRRFLAYLMRLRRRYGSSGRMLTVHIP